MPKPNEISALKCSHKSQLKQFYLFNHAILNCSAYIFAYDYVYNPHANSVWHRLLILPCNSRLKTMPLQKYSLRGHTNRKFGTDQYPVVFIK